MILPSREVAADRFGHSHAVQAEFSHRCPEFAARNQLSASIRAAGGAIFFRGKPREVSRIPPALSPSRKSRSVVARGRCQVFEGLGGIDKIQWWNAASCGYERATVNVISWCVDTIERYHAALLQIDD